MFNNMVKYPLILATLILWGCTSGSNGTDVNYHSVTDFAKPCAGASQCQSQRCIEMNDILGCSSYCYGPGQCSDGFYCAYEPSSESSSEEQTEKRGLCRPLDSDKICHSCSNDNQCDLIGGFCKRQGQANYCLMNCELDGCPDGFTCTENDDGAKYCVPNTDDCTCNALKLGTIRSCSLTNEYGECPGTITCEGGETGWTTCNGDMPGPESCDGIDNNCDGNIDEGLLGTVSHCSQCFDACMGSGLPGTVPVCIDDSCGIDCHDDYYDANDNAQDGCECVDDTEGVASIDDTVSLGSYTDCDFTFQLTTSLVPGGSGKTAHPDYFKYNFQNVWNCSENLQVKLKIYSSGVAHELCASSANDTNEANWNCVTVQPGSEATIHPYNNDGAYYIKVSLANTGELNCMPYELTIVEN